ALLAGCSASPHSGRAQLVAPGPVSVAYSELNMELALVTVRSGAATPDARDAFDQRVARLGAALAASAFSQYPLLRRRFERFEFIIAEKDEMGTVSSGSGRVALLRPVSALAVSDAALAFIMAREMAHVIADHHGENTGASLAVSGLALLLFPLTGISNAVGALFAPTGGAAAAGSASPIAANVTTTAASFVGTRAVVLSYRSAQIEEADAIAVQLLAPLCHAPRGIAEAFAGAAFPPEPNRWGAALQGSIKRLAAPKARLVRLGRDAQGNCPGQTF
ncbi:MAG: M48 family metalloprotease, partial [Betaproteobacteria bacterium]